MDMEMNDDLGATIDRLAAAAGLLEQTVERLEAQLSAAEQKIAALEARGVAPAPTSGRKTLPTAMTTLLAKQGVTLGASEQASIEAGSLDAALSSLSLEQRIAVKSQLIRAGMLA
jgi:hypothetical protein